MRVRCHIIISKSKPLSTLVSFWAAEREGGDPKEAVPDPPPCRHPPPPSFSPQKGIMRSATISKLHILSQSPRSRILLLFGRSGVGFTTCCESLVGRASRRSGGRGGDGRRQDLVRFNFCAVSYSGHWKSSEPGTFEGYSNASLFRCVSGSVTGFSRHYYDYVICKAAGDRITEAAQMAMSVTLSRCVVFNGWGFVVASLGLYGWLPTSLSYVRLPSHTCAHIHNEA